MTRKEFDRLRLAAYKADDAYSNALDRAYGKRAGEMRYRYSHGDPAVQSAMLAKLAADKAYWAAQDVWGGPL